MVGLDPTMESEQEFKTAPQTTGFLAGLPKPEKKVKAPPRKTGNQIAL